MKKYFLMLLSAMLLTCCTKHAKVVAQTIVNESKTLVVYYSYTGNCEEIVNTLLTQIDADVMRIEPADKTQHYEANNYAIGMQLLNAIKNNPNDASSYPAIDPVSITDLATYQNIIIVTPLWWSQMAAIMQTYLFHHGIEMADKNVALIVSSASSGISSLISDAQRLIPETIWAGDALWINNSNRSQTRQLITNWLSTLNFQSPTTEEMKMYITIDNVTQSATLVTNAATEELMEALKSGDITLTLNDNVFEIWGALDRTLPTSNEQMTAQPGDIVLYNGQYICIFYSSNSYNYTRLGKIEDLSENELRKFLKAGQNNITVTLSLSSKTTDINDFTPTLSRNIEENIYLPNGQQVGRTAKGICITNGKKNIKKP